MTDIVPALLATPLPPAVVELQRLRDRVAPVTAAVSAASARLTAAEVLDRNASAAAAVAGSADPGPVNRSAVEADFLAATRSRRGLDYALQDAGVTALDAIRATATATLLAYKAEFDAANAAITAAFDRGDQATVTVERAYAESVRSRARYLAGLAPVATPAAADATARDWITSARTA